jgi:tetratricopeptide (TPR) repeat protein
LKDNYPFLPLLVFIVSCFCCPQNASGSSDIFFSKELKTAYEEVLQLKLDHAAIILQSQKVLAPDNLAIDFIEDYIDFFKIYITEDKTLFNGLAPRENIRLDRLKKLALDSNPYKLYIQAEINLHWGLLQLKFGNYLNSFNRVKKAYKLLQENQKKFPAFTPNLKSLGIIHALISTIPNEWSWVLKTFTGMSGDMNTARFELEQVMMYGKQNEFLFHEETVIMYGLLVTNFDNDPSSGWNMIQLSKLDPAQSPLISYIYALLAVKNGKTDEAIRYLEKSPHGPAYHPFYLNDFLLGLAKLRRLDSDASIYLKRYVELHHGMHYIKECYQKLAWDALIKGNINGYRQYLGEVKTNGSRLTDEDKQAYREAQQNNPPDITLLKARLLSDGGYLVRAENLLRPQLTALLGVPTSVVEGNYRMGRILHLQKKQELAIPYYLKASELGAKSPAYFACAALLQTGIIYENLNSYKLARYYYEKCLDTNPSEYSAGLHQKAKAGINRLKD